MKKILILMGRYLPGHKDGGPLRTIINLTEALGDEYEFYIAALDRDHGDIEPYKDILYDRWNKVGKAKVWYVTPGGFTEELILCLSDGMDLLYLTSFYDDYGYKTLGLKKKGKINCPIALASMGVFSHSALAHKALKKKVFITGCKMIGLFRDVTWSVTSELEAEDVKRIVGSNIRYVVAEDLPRTAVPGRTKEWEENIKIAFLSRICDHKGLDIAIDALIEMKYKNVVFNIYGPIQEENYWNECKAKLEQSGLNWTYFGDVPTDDVQKELATQDVLVFPSKSENYGHVVFEALSVGCIPVISDRTPWAVLNERGVGYVVPREIKAFANALDVLSCLSVEEKNKKSEMAVALAREKVEVSKKKTGYRKIFG